MSNVPGVNLSVVLPAHDEEANIGRAIGGVTAAADRLCDDHEVIVGGDGSADRTAELVEKAAADDPRIRLGRHGRNRGYGAAVPTGFRGPTMGARLFPAARNHVGPQ